MDDISNENIVKAFYTLDKELLLKAIKSGEDINSPYDFFPSIYSKWLQSYTWGDEELINYSEDEIIDFLSFALENGLDLNTIYIEDDKEHGIKFVSKSANHVIDQCATDKIVEFLLNNGLASDMTVEEKSDEYIDLRSELEYSRDEKLKVFLENRIKLLEKFDFHLFADLEKIKNPDRKSVDYKVRYIGKGAFDLQKGKIYECVAEWNDDEGEVSELSIVDDSGEDYMYPAKLFKKIP